ncbi:unnamed protein product [Urochloa humidicola]
MSSSGSGSKSESKPEDELLGYEVHGYRKLDDLPLKIIMDSARDVWLIPEAYLAILYNADLYIKRYPQMLVEVLPTQSDFLNEEDMVGTLVLCRKGVQDTICWNLVEPEVEVLVLQ